MRRFLIIPALLLVGALAFPTVAVADEAAAAEATKKALESVEALATYIAKDGADFDGGNDLYKAAKDALTNEADLVADEAKRAGAKRYAEIQPEVARVMERESVPPMAWVMGLFGAFLLWGGFFFCLGVARKKGGSGGQGDA